MRIYSRIFLQWDEQRSRYVTVDSESTDYTGPVALCCGATQGQKDVANQQLSAYQALQQQGQAVFGDSSSLFNDLRNSLAPIVAAGPGQEGFSPAEKSALQSQAITNTGNAYRNAKQAAGEAMAAQGGGNIGDVTGGSNAAINLGIAESAANQTSNELNQIDQADYATGRQNYENAVQGLGSSTGVFNPATSAAEAATGSGTAAANTQNEIAQQDNSWVGAVTGALGGIAGAATGGLIRNFGSGSTPKTSTANG